MRLRGGSLVGLLGLALASTLATPPAAAATAGSQEPVEAPEPAPAGEVHPFDRLRGELRAAPGAEALEDFDFTALRHRWTEHSSYRPYLHTQARYHRVIQGLKESLERGDSAAAVDLCAASWDLYLMDVQWNLGCSRAYGKAGDTRRAQVHRRIAEGLRDSILASGDGAGPETAYRVVSVLEEQAAIQALGLVAVDTTSAHPDGGHFDVVTVRPRDGGEGRAIYFDVQPLWTWLRTVQRRALRESPASPPRPAPESGGETGPGDADLAEPPSW